MLWLIGNVGGIIGLVSRLNSPKKLNYSKVYLANLTMIWFTPLSTFPPNYFEHRLLLHFMWPSDRFIALVDQQDHHTLNKLNNFRRTLTFSKNHLFFVPSKNGTLFQRTLLITKQLRALNLSSHAINILCTHPSWISLFERYFLYHTDTRDHCDRDAHNIYMYICTHG
jgi:hypothetical protein